MFSFAQFSDENETTASGGASGGGSTRIEFDFDDFEEQIMRKSRLVCILEKSYYSKNKLSVIWLFCYKSCFTVIKKKTIEKTT